MNIAAVIDLGTNTFHLLIADIGGETPSILYQESIAVKLGEGGILDGRIRPEAFERGIAALRQFKSSIDRFQATNIKAAATSALRSASNGHDFLQKSRSESGIAPEIIDGDNEAFYIYQGVRAAINMQGETSLIVDIGGGSVEFIICNDQEIFWKKSFDIGTARLMDLLHDSDPISETDSKALYNYLDTILIDLKKQLTNYNPTLLIGSAGAFETFAGLINPEFQILFEEPEFTIALNEFEKVASTILKSTHEERSLMPAIPPVRVDMIVMATLLTRYILELNEFKEIKLSGYSMKEGILFGMLSDRG